MAVVLSGLMLIGFSATPVVVIGAVGAFTGLVFALTGLRASGTSGVDRAAAFWVAASGMLAFAVMMAPLVGSGRAGVLGYVFNNDPAAHLSVVELLRSSGLHFFDGSENTFLQVSSLLEGSYPIGSHTLVLYTSALSGTEGFFIWTPLIAVAASGTALSIRWLLAQFGLPAWASSVGAVLAACSYLPLAYFAQGGYKELLFGMTVMLGAATFEFARQERFAARALIPFVVSAGGGLAVFGPAAAFWFLPIGGAMFALALWKPSEGRSRRQIITAFAAVAGVALLVLLPELIASLNFVSMQNKGVATEELGNLLTPLRWYESLGVWLNADYRLAPVDHRKVNALVLVVAFASMAFGLFVASRRKQPALAVALGSSLIAAAWLHKSYSPYFEAKGLMVMALPAATLVVVGVATVMQRRHAVGIAVAALLLLGAGYSYWLVYSSVWMTPKNRLTELAQFNQKLAGEKGRVLVNDRDAYAKLMMRDSRATDIWSSWIPGSGVLTITGAIENPPHTPDSDDYADVFRNKFTWILDRKHPGSRPPGNYRQVADSEHYRLWRRVAPPAKKHISLAYGVVGGAAALQCDSGDIKRLIDDHPRAKVRVAIAPETVTRQMIRGKVGTKVPPNFLPGPQAGIFLRDNANSASAETVDLVRGLRYEVMVQGSFGPGFMHWANGEPTGSARQDLGTQDGWQMFGDTVGGDGPTTVLLTAETKPSWQAGSRRGDLVGQTAFVPESGDKLVVTTGRGLKRYCGRNVDWVEQL